MKTVKNSCMRVPQVVEPKMRDAVTLKQPVKSVCDRIRGEAYNSPFHSAPLI